MITFEEELIAYYQEYGKALAIWTEVESSMYLLTTTVFPEDSHPMLGMGFIGIEGFHSKTKFAERAIRRGLASHPRKEIREELGVIVDKLRTASTRRNILAHNKTIPFPTNIEGRRVALCPWSMPKGTDKTKPPPESLCLIDIVRERYQFAALIATVLNYSARVGGVPEPFPKDAELPHSLPTIQTIVRQIHEELGHPKKSSRDLRRENDEKNAACSLNVELPKVNVEIDAKEPDEQAKSEETKE